MLLGSEQTFSSVSLSNDMEQLVEGGSMETALLGLLMGVGMLGMSSLLKKCFNKPTIFIKILRYICLILAMVLFVTVIVS